MEIVSSVARWKLSLASLVDIVSSPTVVEIIISVAEGKLSLAWQVEIFSNIAGWKL